MKLFTRTSLSVLALSSSLAILSGCANMVATAPVTNSLNTGGSMTGSIHGGNQPIAHATIQLFSVGTTGYGSAGTLYASTTTSNSGSGSFAFTQTPQASNTPGPTTPVSSIYGCPAVGDPQMYLLATGGDPGAGDNPAAAALVAIGKCSTIGSIFVDMNEVTTVATMAAMQQYFNPTADTLGSPATAQAMLGLANAQTTIPNLVNISTGNALLATAPASSVTGVTLTATPETAKLNTIANILAACVNTTGALTPTDSCSVLFANAIPQTNTLTSQPTATFATATDVVQAAYYMFTNPTESQDNGASGKLSKIFALSSPQPAFTPSLATQPLDWTLGIAYTTTNTCPTGSRFLNVTLKSVAIDKSGNVWLNGGSASSNSLIQLSPSASPLNCYGPLATGLGLTIDPAGNVYSASASSILEVPASGATPFSWTAANLSGIVADKSGNVFYAPTTATPMQEFVGASTATAAAPSISVGANLTAGTYFSLASDGKGRVLAPASGSAAFTDLYPVNPGTNGYTYANIGSSTYQTNSYGAAVDSSNNFFSGNTCCAAALNNTFYKLTIADPVSVGATPTYTKTNSVKYLGGLVGSRSTAVDGAGNIWAGMLDPVINANTTATPPIPKDIYALAEFTNDLLTGISPNGITPATCSATGPDCQTQGGFQKAGLATVVSLAIDPSGNVWAAAQQSSTLVEIIGQAVPVVTPVVVSPGTKP